jgi:hypothetical protein
MAGFIPNSEEMKMRLQDKASTPMELIATALLLAIGMGLSVVTARGAEAVTDVAYVEDVSGRVVASAQGKPALLEALDVISDRTRLDLQPDSELRICHFRTQRLVTLKGPLRASISQTGVTAENGKAIDVAAGACVVPVESAFQGGTISRGLLKAMSVPLQPNIKIVNRGAEPIRQVALWDGQKVLVTFDHNAARPTLDDGQSYQLVVERNDGSKFKMTLQGSATTRTEPLIFVVR